MAKARFFVEVKKFTSRHSSELLTQDAAIDALRSGEVA
jgi:hypothetical protein